MSAATLALRRQRQASQPFPHAPRSWAPWCSTCKAIRSEYERAADLAAKFSLPVKLGRFDANKHGRYARDTLGLNQMPTFYLFRHANVEPEEGHDVTPENFTAAAFVRRDDFPTFTTGEAYAAGLAAMLGLRELDIDPAKVFDLGTEAFEVASWLFWRGTGDGKIPTTVVLYHDKETPSPDAAADAALLAAFRAASRNLMRFSNLRFAVVHEPTVMDEFEVPRAGVHIRLYKEHDEGSTDYSPRAWPGYLADRDPDATGDLTVDLQRFILVQDVPLVTDIWHRTLQSWRRRVRHLALFFVKTAHAEDEATMTRLLDGLKSAVFDLEAEGLLQRGNFTIGVADGEKYAAWMTHFGLHKEIHPSIGMEDTLTKKEYALPPIAHAVPPEPSPTPVPGDGPADGLLGGGARTAVAVDAGGETSSAPVTAPPTDGSTPDFNTGFEHKMPETRRVPWIDVPVAAVKEALRAYFAGRVQEVYRPAPAAAKEKRPINTVVPE